MNSIIWKPLNVGILCYFENKNSQLLLPLKESALCYHQLHLDFKTRKTSQTAFKNKLPGRLHLYEGKV